VSTIQAVRSLARRLRPTKGFVAEGFTIVELLVSMILLAVVSTTFLAATNAIYKGIHKQQGITNAADGNRVAFETLDKQVRYASAINAPATASDGNFYMEYMWSKSNGSIDTLTCSQWRLNPTTDVLQWRSWTAGTTPNPTPSWTTIDTGVANVPSTQPPFALQGATGPASGAGGTGPTMQYQVLKVSLITKRDTGNLTTSGNLTALDTPNSSVPSPSVCQEVARS
jgi:hypothetical protein